MQVRDIMSTPVVTIGSEDSLAVAREHFENTGFRHLPVVEAGKLCGMLSHRHLVAALSPNLGTPAELPKDTATLNRRVHQIMVRKPISLEPSAEIATAIAIINENKISCLPITDAQNSVVGMVSWRDILRRAEQCQFNGD